MPLTVLAPVNRQRPSPIYFRNVNAEIRHRVYPNFKHFICKTRSADSLDDLCRELSQIEHEQRCLVPSGDIFDKKRLTLVTSTACSDRLL